MNRKMFVLAAGSAAAALALAGCSGSGFEETDSPSSGSDDTGAVSSASIEVLIGSSGDAETAAVQEAVAAWADANDATAEVVVASDLTQQLSQGFAGGNPSDLFYLSTDLLASYAANGSIVAYGDELADKDDFYQPLVDAFTVDGQFYCAPKDFSTLALVINTDMWAEAGLTDADYPTTWDELADVASKLTTADHVGLTFSPEVQRVGVFLAQAGGGFVSDDGTTAIVDSAENEEALQYVKDHLNDGTFAYSSDLGAGWGGEAFGTEQAAMAIEGNWITGGLASDYPDVNYTVVELSAGPAGQGTIQYTNCWGVATDADNVEGAKQLAEYLTQPEQQMAFAEAFGVMPSRASVAEEWKAEYPEMSAFIDGAEYAINLPSQQGASDVLSDMNSKLETLKDADVASLLSAVNTSMQAVLDDAN